MYEQTHSSLPCLRLCCPNTLLLSINALYFWLSQYATESTSKTESDKHMFLTIVNALFPRTGLNESLLPFSGGAIDSTVEPWFSNLIHYRSPFDSRNCSKTKVQLLIGCRSFLHSSGSRVGRSASEKTLANRNTSRFAAFGSRFVRQLSRSGTKVPLQS